MKTKIISMMAALLMLLSTSAMAQSNDIKGDVNGDGIVDVADIAAVIAIMKQNDDGKTKYYWYAGWTEPTEANITTIVNETYPASKTSTTMNPAGKIANSTDGVIMDYNAANIYNKAANVQYYIVVPNGQGIYDSLGTKLHLDDAAFTIYSSTTIANHTIYISSSASRIIDVIIKK